MLSKDKIIKNAKKYFSTGEKYGFMTDELVNFLGEDFITAPATNRKDLYGAYEGGLIEHLLKVTKYAVSINSMLDEDKRVDIKSLIKVTCLHQIGKAKLFIPSTSQWEIDKGIYYNFNSDLVAMRIGERSAYYSLINGINLNGDEYQAIINYDKPDDDKQSKWYTNKLGIILKQANELTINI